MAHGGHGLTHATGGRMIGLVILAVVFAYLVYWGACKLASDLDDDEHAHDDR